MDSILDQNAVESDLRLNRSAQDFLYEAARWGKFLAIVGFVIIGLMVLLGIGMGVFMGSFASLADSSDYSSPLLGMMGGGAFTLIYLVFAALYFFPTLYLYRFSTNAMTAIKQAHSHQVELSMENLKSMFKFMGILMIIILSFYALIFLFGIGAAMLTSL